MMKKTTKIILFIILGLGSLAISYFSLVYFNNDERAPFIIEKLPLFHEDFYVWVLRFHVISASLSLPGCLILSSKNVLKRWPRFHRYSGRIIGMIILTFLVPSGFYLAFFAKGGWAGILGFLLTGAITFFAMIQAIRLARAKQYQAHRRFSMHVLGQLSVAVSSRAMLFGFAFYNFNPDTTYLISLWVPVLGTFALIELMHFSKQPFSFFLRRSHEKVNPRFSPIHN